MTVPTGWSDISSTAGSNSPISSEIVGPNMNQYIQAAFAFAKQLYEGQQLPIAPVPFNNQKITGLANGTVATDAATFGQLGNYLPLGGGTVTGPVVFNSTAQLFGSTSITYHAGAALTIVSNTTNGLIVSGSGAGQGGNIRLFDGSSSTSKFLRCQSNKFDIVNAGYTAAILTLDDAGNLSVTGNITSPGVVTASNFTMTSDERLKKDWEYMDSGFVDSLMSVKAGRYSRIDTGERQVGVSAQSLQRVIPEAVLTDENGMLSVSYGNAALVAVIEMAKELSILRRRVAQLEQK